MSLYIQNTASAPRSWKILYYFDSISGPFIEYASYTMNQLEEGYMNVHAIDESVIAARYWKIEILSNWGDHENVELKEVPETLIKAIIATEDKYGYTAQMILPQP